ncbi:heterogeneous nuclear ribonucleoprotein A1, A2/B1 homolog [Asparagus officinalis]|uniref:heterogeneous nuclear ribonucleoprotein A1, A2/B1 homolog n=1 Tax=Asparagus officinalis TaxID=4686 RepID=UPI00098E4C4F|nr:heterogeneous nuclear ribonucleoprotein A1, A2/B1 homolog [Asparagus officinalis]
MDSKENNTSSEVEMKIEEEQAAAAEEAAADGEAAEAEEETKEEGKESEMKEEEEAQNNGEGDNEAPSASNKPSIEGASPGKIFVGGLPKDTTDEAFKGHFERYGKIVDSVIMKHRGTGHPRGFGFITYEDPSVVDAVITDTHKFEGKQVEIKRTIPKGAISGKDFKTKKIFVGGIPTSINEDEFRNFFSKFGEIEEHQIMRDHTSGRSRGFGFIAFNSEKAVDELLTKGNRIEFAGAQVEIKKAEPKKPGSAPAPPPPTKHYSNSRPGFGRGFKDQHYGGAAGRGAESGAYRYGRGSGSRARGYGGYGVSEFDGGYGGYGSMPIGSYRSESSVGFSGRYGGGLGRGYGLGGYDGPSESYGRYGGATGYGRGYDSGAGVGGYDSSAGFGAYDSGAGVGSYGGVGGYGGTGTGLYGYSCTPEHSHFKGRFS